MPAMFEKTAGEYASAKPCRPEGCRLGFAVRKRGGDSIECNFRVLVFVCGIHLRSSVVYFPSVFRRRKFRLRLPSRTLVLGERTLVMGVLNVTPDSFSDGGLFLDADAAMRQALEIERAGADILDIGDRKSTRLNSSHANISYAVFCLKKKNNQKGILLPRTRRDCQSLSPSEQEDAGMAPHHHR